MDNCLFCKIIKGEIPSEKVYEDDDFIAFLDINPVTPGHTLVVPKQHSDNVLDTDDEILEKMAKVLKKISHAVCQGLETQSFNLHQNSGKLSGQVVPHLHWHIVPRYEDDGLKIWPGKPYLEGEEKIVAEKIREAL
ncbi:HIT family protein [Patescibacteria group bacterium]|nr:HIT family protein [Patescibacteria group bacterium]MBU1921818.1 HIT family protein [Patescibacteria group bacterium]